jgi:hypothetical protein
MEYGYTAYNSPVYASPLKRLDLLWPTVLLSHSLCSFPALPLPTVGNMYKKYTKNFIKYT